MIRNNILNFSNDLIEASKYRLNLRDSILETKEKRDIESLFLSRTFKFDKVSFYSPKSRKIISANEYNSFYKNYAFFIYYNFKKLKTVERIVESFYKKTEIYFKSLNKELKILKNQIEETSLQLNSKYNKVRVFSLFKEKDFTEQYDLVDIKTESQLKFLDKLSFKTDWLELPALFNNKVDVLKAEVDWAKSFYGDFNTPLNISKETSYLHRANKTYNFIVGKKAEIATGQVLPDREVNASFIFHFNGSQYVNQFYVEFASELNTHLMANGIEYWSGETWVVLDSFSLVDEFNRIRIYFNEINTKKVRLTFLQKKYYDTVAVKDESSLDSKLKLFFKNKNISFKDKIVNNQIAKVYDLSIKEVAFSYKKHKSFGFYRESEVVAVNKMLSFDMTVDYLLEDVDTYLEKSAHVVLYGEEEFEAFKRSNKNFQQTPRINSIIPISNNRIKEKELLVFKNKDARCLFFPNIRKTGAATLAERIIVKKDGAELSLSTDYNISLDELETFIPNTNNFGLLEQAYPVKQAGLFYISLNKRPEVGSIYTVEYDLDRDFYLDESKLIKLKNGSVVLDKSLRGSAGFIRPRVILRSGSRINNSSLIKKYKVLIEELEENIEESLLYEEFIEINSRSTNNVI